MAKNKRDKKYYPGYRGKLPRNRRWRHDIDYWDTLSEDNKAWMDKFLQEYYHSNFTGPEDERLHDTDELRRSCYHIKNCDDRDIMSLRGCVGKIYEYSDTQNPNTLTPETKEDILNSMIDADKNIEDKKAQGYVVLSSYIDAMFSTEEFYRRKEYDDDE